MARLPMVLRLRSRVGLVAIGCIIVLLLLVYSIRSSPLGVRMDDRVSLCPQLNQDVESRCRSCPVCPDGNSSVPDVKLSLYDRWEPIHPRVDQIIQRFIDKQNEILSQPPGNRRFLLYRIQDYGQMGFGNKILSVISAVYWAMMTDRAFLMSGTGIEKEFEVDRLDWRLENAHMSAEEQAAKTIVQWGLGMPGDKDDIRVNFGAESDAKVIQLESTQYFLPGLRAFGMLGLTEPKSFAEVEEAFGSDFYPPLSRLIINFNEENYRELDSFVKSNFDGYFVVGIQIREEHMCQIDRERQSFLRCAEQIAKKHSIDVRDDRPVRYFLATDASNNRDHARKRFGENLIVYDGHNSAFMDMMLLSFCDERILTFPKSTFGFVSNVNGRLPHVVYSGKNKPDMCARLPSVEPCFHGFFHRTGQTYLSAAVESLSHTLHMNNCYMCNKKDCESCEEFGLAPDGKACYGDCF